VNDVKESGSAEHSSSDRPAGADYRRRRILVSAYAFSPVHGSEPSTGWNICSRLAAYHDVTVLTRSWNENLWPEDWRRREEAERFMRDHGPVPGLTIHFVASPALSRLLQPRPLVNLRSPFFFQGYAAWQRAAYREAVCLHRDRPFDVTHQLTITSFREPGYLWKLRVPFIWGPIGGGGNIPWSCLADFGSHDRLYYALKNVANKMHVWTKWRSRMAARRAERVFVTSEELYAVIDRWGGTPRLMLDTGSPNWAGRPRCFDGMRPLRLCWIGLHIGRKALPLLLYALAELRQRGLGEKVHLTILGTGPETHAWQALGQQLQVQQMTTWTGQVPYQQVREELDTQDALVMSSLQEGTSNVLMEALAAGLPVICHDISGISVAIDENCGIKIPLRDRRTSILQFADAIARLVTTKGLLNRLSEGALHRAKALSWDEKVQEIVSAYDARSTSNKSKHILSKRRRILISAYAFSPVQGSEPGMGWNICSRLAAYHDVTVLTRSWNENLWPEDEPHRKEAEQFLRDHGPIPGLTIHFVKSPPLSRLLQTHPLVSLRSPFFFQGYAAWQRAAYREAVRLHREQPFDVTHQLTVTSFREPGYLWKLDVPFIWGPIGGGGNIPWSYFADFGKHDRLYYTLKNVANKMHVWTKRRSRMAARRAERVFVNSTELNAMMLRWGRNSDIMLDTGAQNWTGRPRCYDGMRPLRLCWGALHVGRKALPLFLRVVAELKRRGFGEKVHITIMGAGPETEAWQTLCQQLQVQEMTTWMGQIPFQQLREELDEQDAFVTSGLQEGTPTIVMDALAVGLPVICNDIAGMSFAIDESCGIKIPLRDRQTSIQQFADAIVRLVTSNGLLNTLSEGALRRAKALSWDEKVREIANAYDAAPLLKSDSGPPG
jgi:glycosyltransferase involved in cell wall biosynthesis